jgi:hypothetical protein
MYLLEEIPDLDCRKYKKDFGDRVKNQKDFLDWTSIHQLEYHWQDVIRREYLDHYRAVRFYDLGLALRKDYFLSWDVINLILKHLVEYNKFVQVDRLVQTDERKFLLFLYPRFPVNVRGPYSLLSFNYYEELEKL